MTVRDWYEVVPGDCYMALIVKGEGADLWTNQCGGYACNHPVSRGSIVPIMVEDDLYEKIVVFCVDDHGGWMTHCTSSDADTLDILLAPLQCRCDRSFCRDDYMNSPDDASQEAWLHVIHNELGPAVLVWGNSD